MSICGTDGEEPSLQLRGEASPVRPPRRRESARDLPSVQGDGLVRGDRRRYAYFSKKLDASAAQPHVFLRDE